jgi:hypothetical protein
MNRFRKFFLDVLDKIDDGSEDTGGMPLGSYWEMARICYDIPYWRSFVSLITPEWIPRYIGGFICKHFGHDWEDDSYGGPESGCMAGHCNRCGYSFHHTLY